MANCISLELDDEDETNTTFIGKFNFMFFFNFQFFPLGRDCINGTLMEKNKMPRKVNFTRLLQIFGSGKTKESF